MRIILFLLTIFIVISCKDTIDNEKILSYGKLEGFIKNNYGQPIKDADVSIGKMSIKTALNGYYSFKLLVGDYTVNVTKSSYLNKTKAVSIKTDQTDVLDFELTAGTNYLDISESQVRLLSGRGVFSIKISSNADWQIIHSSNWIDNNNKLGGGDASIAFAYAENKSDSPHVDTIQFISGSVKKLLTVWQGFPLRLLKASAMIGNEELAFSDSFKLEFNKPVVVESVNNNSTACISAINTRQSVDKRVVYFSNDCAKLGGDFSFSIRVKDSDGNIFNKSLSIPIYSTKHIVSGYITDFLLINNDTEVLISTCKLNDGKIYRYSIASDSILETYDLSNYVNPIRLTFNPSDSKIYIIGADPNTMPNMGVFDPTYFVPNLHSLYTLDLKTDQIKKEFTFQPESPDNPYPYIIPCRIAFTSSGAGVVVFIDEMSNGFRSAGFDNIPGDSLNQKISLTTYTEYMNVHANFDYSKIYMIQPWGQEYFGVFNGDPKETRSFVPKAESRSNEITLHRKTDKIYFRNLYDQFIGSQSGYKSASSYLDSRHYGKADFSYRENEESIVYCCEAQSYSGYPIKFRVLDYSKGTTLLKCDVIEGLHNFTTTIDGKWAIAYKMEPGEKSNIFVFNTDIFYRK